MCLSKAWFRGEITDKPIMENIARIRIENGNDLLLFSSLIIEQ
jgi:hypothetical protein